MDFTDLQFIAALGALTLRLLVICGGALTIGLCLLLAANLLSSKESDQ
jgi:hypothetical protein